MFLTKTLKAFSFSMIMVCAACSSPGQSGQKTVDMEQAMYKTMLNVGIRKPAESVSSSVVQFYINNDTATDANLLVWGTPLEKRLSADIFTVSKNGVAMPYLGRMVKRGSPAAGDYTTINAGDSLETLIDIASYYDMSATGKYTVTLNLAKTGDASRLNQETTVSVDESTLILTIGQ